MRPILAAASLTLLSPPAQEIAFAPAEDAALEKRFTVSIAQELDELSILAGGTDVSGMIGDFDVTLTVDTALTVLDTYGASSGGSPESLTRTYDEIGLEVSTDYVSEMGSGTESQTVESDLEGETVVFTRRDGGDGYDVAFEKDEGDDRLLEGLAEDLDLRAFLPPGEVEEAEEWTIRPNALKSVLAPGGALGMGAAEDGADWAEEMSFLNGIDFDTLSESLLEGDVTCTFTGTRDEEAGALAVIEILVEIDSVTDLRDLITEMLEELADESPADIRLQTADLELSMEGTGLLLWNLDAGRFQHFEASIDTELVFHFVAEADDDAVDATIGLSGALELGADVVDR